MSKITLNDLANLQNENTAVTKINQNNSTLEAAIDNTISRDGTTPNQMLADLDMNNHDILNVKEIVFPDDITITQLPTGAVQGSLIYRNASKWDVLEPGSNNQFLKTSGDSADPVWFDLPGGGDMVKAFYDPTEQSKNVFDGFPIADKDDIANLDTTEFSAVYLTESGVEGNFVWDNSNLSSEVTADPAEGTYIPPASAPTGASGAWRRIRPNGNLFKTSEYGDDIAKTIASASTNGGGLVEIDTVGTLTISNGIIKPSNVQLVGMGSDKTIIKPEWSSVSNFASLTGDGVGHWVMACQDGNNGSMTELPSFSAVGTSEVQLIFGSAHGLVVGDEFCIYDTGNGSFYGARDYYRRGERHTVMGVSGLTVYLDYGTLDSYTYGSTVKAYKVSKWAGKLGGFSIDASDLAGSITSWGAIKIFRASFAEIDDLDAFECDNSGIEFDQCLGLRPTRIKSSSKLDSSGDLTNYPILISNSTDVIVLDSVARGVWSGTDIGGYDTPGAFQNYKSGFERCTITNIGTSPAASVHGNSQDCFYRHCFINGGALLGGLNFTLESCDVKIWRGNCPVLYYGSDVVSGNFDIINCNAYSQENAGGADTPTAAVYFRVEEFAKDEVFFNIRGGSIFASAETRPFYLEAISDNAPLSYCIENTRVEFGSADSYGMVYALKSGDTSTPRYAIMRNIYGYTPSKPWGSWAGGYSAYQTEMPRQKGIWSDVSSSSSSERDASFTFLHSYPSTYTMGASATLLTNALGPNVHADIRSLDYTSVRPLVATGDNTNLPSGASFTVSWEVW